MHEEKCTKAQRQQKVLPPGHLVTAKPGGKPVDLCWLIHRQPGNQASRSHQNRRAVRYPLGFIVFGLLRQLLADMKSHQHHLRCLPKAFTRGNDKAPFARVHQIEHI